MIFPKESLALILQGRKTTDLRPIIPGAPAPEGVHRVQRRRGTPVCQIRITDATIIQLETVTDADARAEGFPTAGAYRDEWCRTHYAAWTDQAAWLITFQVEADRERTRFLAKRDDYAVGKTAEASRRDLELLDTLPEQAAQERAARAYRLELSRTIDDAEAPDPEHIVRFAADAAERWEDHRLDQAATWAQLPLHVRLAMAQRDAAEHHANISPHLRVIERQLAQIERKTRRAA